MIVLNKDPDFVPRKFVLDDGSEFTIHYKYRKAREAMAVLQAYADAAQKVSEHSGFNVQEMDKNPLTASSQYMDGMIQVNKVIFTDITVGWDLPYDFTPENIEELGDRYPAVMHEVIQTYVTAMQGARVKN